MTDEFLPQGEVRIAHEASTVFTPTIFPQAIDLLNVAFENPRSLSNKPECANHATSIYDTPDRLTGISTYEELCRTRPDRQWNFVQVDVPYSIFSERRADIIASMWPNNTAMDLVSCTSCRSYPNLLTVPTEYRTGFVLCSCWARQSTPKRRKNGICFASSRTPERPWRRRAARRVFEAQEGVWVIGELVRSN